MQNHIDTITGRVASTAGRDGDGEGWHFIAASALVGSEKYVVERGLEADVPR